LHLGEASVIAPPEAELDTLAGDSANSTAWLGCIVAPNSLMDGEVTETLDGIASAEACCRLCRERGEGVCNTWNYCPAAGGCRLVLFPITPLQMQQGMQRMLAACWGCCGAPATHSRRRGMHVYGVQPHCPAAAPLQAKDVTFAFGLSGRTAGRKGNLTLWHGTT